MWLWLIRITILDKTIGHAQIRSIFLELVMSDQPEKHQLNQYIHCLKTFSGLWGSLAQLLTPSEAEKWEIHSLASTGHTRYVDKSYGPPSDLGNMHGCHEHTLLGYSHSNHLLCDIYCEDSGRKRLTDKLDGVWKWQCSHEKIAPLFPLPPSWSIPNSQDEHQFKQSKPGLLISESLSRP